MKRLACFLSLALLIPLISCTKERLQNVVDPQLGYSVVFPVPIIVYPGTSKEIQPRPAEWVPVRYTESTPFGEITWFTRAVPNYGRSQKSLVIEVGNLPPGNQGGSNIEEILDTLKDWNTKRFPGVIYELDSERGPGFEYQHRRGDGSVIKGIIVLRRGRIHHARASSKSLHDPKILTFLNSFNVNPENP